MHLETQIKLLEQFLSNSKSATTGMDPEDSPLSCASYTSKEQLHKELEKLFFRHPVIVGLSINAPNAGDFFTKQIGPVPLLVTRDESSQLRGFYNVCRHRASCLVREDSGQAKKSFACPYHNWTYNTKGELIHIPNPEGFPNASSTKNGLVPIHVEEQHGLIFATLKDPEPTKLAECLSPISEELAALDIGNHRVFKQQKIETGSNWKQTIDQFLETYHIKSIHRNSVRRYFMDNIQYAAPLGLHTRFMFPRANLPEIEAIDKSLWRFRDYANVIYLLFPNTLILVQQDHLITAVAWPNGTGKTVIDYQFLIPSDTPEDQLARFELNHQILLLTIQEDIENGNWTQRGLESGAFENVTIGRFEQGLRYFHRALQEKTLK